MDSMVERVARAIAGHFGPEFDALPKDKAERINRNRVGEMFDDSQEDVLEAARAALLVLLEPTDHMVWKGEGMSDFMLDGECFDNSGDGRRAEMKMAFKVMIAAALDEHEILQARSIRSAMEGE